MQYKVEGTPLPVLTCTLQSGETIITERGGMSWMTPNVEMKTNMQGGLGKAFGRMFSGESMFMNQYTCQGGEGLIAFSSSLPGSIMPFEVTPEKTIIAQKSAFLACESTVELSVHFNKKISGGFFGGEGFIMQKLTGNGMAFLEIDGHCIQYTLEAGQTMIVNTGYLAAMDSTVNMDVKMLSGAKNILFGGEGLFNTVLTGPGNIYLQSMPVSNLAAALMPATVSKK